MSDPSISLVFLSHIVFLTIYNSVINHAKSEAL